jgi:hypothetical protein
MIQEQNCIIAPHKNQRLHPSFQIETSGTKPLVFDQCILLMDVGEKHFCFAIMMADTREFMALEFFQMKAGNNEDEFRELVSNHPLLRQRYQGVHVFYNNGTGILIPVNVVNEDNGIQMLELVTGDLRAGIMMKDHIPEMSVEHIYSVPDYLHNEISRLFPEAVFAHFHSGWIRKKFITGGPSDVMEVLFYPDIIIVVLWINNVLHLIHSFHYDTPEDVSYQLLNIVSQWEISPEIIPVKISGLLETQSAMFTEIFKYFMNVELDVKPSGFQYDFAFDNYPQHFFSPVFSLATCVS